MNVEPGVREPPKELSLAVTVCVTPSLLVQVTVLFTPITTVMLLGLKEKFLMLTLTVLWAVATGADEMAKRPATASTATTSASPRPRFAGI